MRVVVQRDRWIIFEPQAGISSTGLVFYPGCRVQAEAYAPLGKAVADKGYLAVIVPMPFNLAILAPDAADAVIDAYAQVRHWVVGGHSLGGVMAARYAYANQDRVGGLALVAAYPEDGVDLSRSGLPVVTVYADLDGLSELGEIESSFRLQPANATKVKIAGGNHAQFGWYGPQAGDKPAAISHENQHAQLAEVILAFLQEAG